MKKMKAILAIFLAIAFCFIPPLTVTAKADGALEKRYACITDTETYLYLSVDLTDVSRLFILPRTYYVEILSEGEQYYCVKYLESVNKLIPIVGYVKKEKVIEKQPNVRPIYFSATLIKKSTVLMYKSASSGSEVLTAVLTSDIIHYGGFVVGEESWLFISAHGIFGYAQKGDFTEFETPLHADYIAENTKPPTTGDGDNNLLPIVPIDEKDNIMQIILILLVCIPSVILVVMLFKKKNPPIN